MENKIKGHTSNDLILIDNFRRSLYRISGFCSLLVRTAVYRLLCSYNWRTLNQALFTKPLRLFLSQADERKTKRTQKLNSVRIKS